MNSLSADTESRIRQLASVAPTVSSWDIFVQNERFLGTVDVPPDLVVLQISGNYLVARYTRDPNVDELRVYRLLPAR